MVQVATAGVDTWSPCWYVEEDSPAAKAMGALATKPTRRGKLIPDLIDGHRVGYFPSSMLIYAEGHPGEDGGLGSPAGLEDRLETLLEAMGAVGIPLPRGHAHRGSVMAGVRDRPGLAGVRRMDATLDLVFEKPADGMAVLTGIAALEARQTDKRVHYNAGAVGTVDWLTARGIHRRVYDKSLESNLGPRGSRIRFEAQCRWPREMRRAPDELSGSYVRGQFESRFRTLWQSSRGLRVVGQMAMVDELREAVAAGELTGAQAEQIIGYQLLSVGGERAFHRRHTDWRRRRLIAESGFVLAEVEPGEEIDLGDVLDQVVGSDAWDREGETVVTHEACRV